MQLKDFPYFEDYNFLLIAALSENFCGVFLVIVLSQKLKVIQQKSFQMKCGFLNNVFRICEKHIGQERRFKTMS